MISFIKRFLKKLFEAKSINDYGLLLDELRNYIYYDLFETRKIIKAKTLANWFKGTIILYIIFLMYIYQNFQLQSYIYLNLHGSYGLLWVCKSFIFPDPQFEKEMTLLSAIGGVGILSLYLIIPHQMISLNIENNYNINRILLCSFLFIFGVTLMMVSDCQKFYELKYKPKDTNNKTIKSGAFYCCRNPNYLGEMLLYLSFAILSNSNLSYYILFFIWSTVFLVNISCKEFSFIRKPDWNTYKKHSWILLPKVFPDSSLYSSIFYIIIGGVIYITKDFFKAY
ncbi:3-oxo-5-alpha-steroid 4-dehydrogenase (macronuclear) [Tetrahymena thermophila SB210]|uniref:3-oxo-5-alpha-steroid 4-dehydrogenase n=1 Tax=Tetrahymena thermophila (strain SB210) TaxID=312017 RepID=Q22PJ4_TETTS|nr:3-oxo-5-alpha-steroid 4-dehydrogenase [Tetrahymena thermophila SB210]EAR87115.2 3-oxo-5-alpha-steroid 4-dehydrogenase [Tetrahymena thermophila SB210]|eukprot:XP_001007360.2 3-oxo-5-alpha-steroid 4-dehydrogenase [Tetrahymena thermophila SB210]